MSFCLSFHQVVLGPTGAHWLDGAPDVSCKDSTQQYPVDGLLLSCKLLLCQERPTRPKPFPRCPATASVWSPDMAEGLGRRIALGR